MATMRGGEIMEKIKSLVGMVSKKKFFSDCKCYKDNRYGGINCVRPQLSIDEESHLIFCDRCGAIVDPFAAMVIVAIFEKQQKREWDRYMERGRRFWKIAHSYKPYRVALKEMEKNMGRGNNAMLPCCPKCDRAFDPADIKAYVNKKYVCD